MRKLLYSLLLLISCLFYLAGCSSGTKIDITPHQIDPEADAFYRQALELAPDYDVDSTLKCIQLLDNALSIDSMNPNYYGLKSKLLCELGYLDSALVVQSEADRLGAITGEYLFQLALFQAAKESLDEAKENFRRSNEFQKAILKQYPDSLGAFIIQQATNACYHGQDSLYMTDIKSVRERFPDRLMEIEKARRLKPQNLIKQIKSLEIKTPDGH